MLNDLIEYLGKPEGFDGSNYWWQCPLCRDSGKDNLKYNPNKGRDGLLKCFSDDECSKHILRQLNKRKSQNNPTPKNNVQKKPEETLEQRDKRLFPYLTQCMEELMNDRGALDYIYKNRGITEDTTIDMCIGFDRKNAHWVFPVWGLDNNLFGFEYRPASLTYFKPKKEGDEPQKCRKEPGTSSILAQVNSYSDETEVLVIIEGFIDAYLLYQHLKEKKRLKGYHIVTPSNGVGTIKGCIEKNLNLLMKYKKKILYLDNDHKGRENTQKITNAWPGMFSEQEYKCSCEDFGDHYLKCLMKY